MNRLSREFSDQDFVCTDPVSRTELLDRYRGLARGYARMENAISVLSDMHANRSYICHGGFSAVLGIGPVAGQTEEIGSVWETAILKLVHPEDLTDKYLQELHFFHFVKRLPGSCRADYCLMQKLRMKDRFGNYLQALHRLFYIPSPFDESLWLTLCLYNPLCMSLPYSGAVVHTATGRMRKLEKREDLHLLSEREREVLRLIDSGLTSKGIAERLSISVHTVSRHRQKILSKLQVHNSIEACRIAGDLNLI